MTVHLLTVTSNLYALDQQDLDSIVDELDHIQRRLRALASKLEISR